jgi:hypothetical protein
VIEDEVMVEAVPVLPPKTFREDAVEARFSVSTGLFRMNEESPVKVATLLKLQELSTPEEASAVKVSLKEVEFASMEDREVRLTLFVKEHCPALQRAPFTVTAFATELFSRLHSPKVIPSVSSKEHSANLTALLEVSTPTLNVVELASRVLSVIETGPLNVEAPTSTFDATSKPKVPVQSTMLMVPEIPVPEIVAPASVHPLKLMAA